MTQDRRGSVGPLAVHDQLAWIYRSYYETEFDLRDTGLAARRADLLGEIGGLSREPFLEFLPDYVPSDLDVRQVCERAGVSKQRGLLDAGLLSGINRPYAHQVQALEGFLAGHSVVVTSGTGSGKTESFLLPILALW